MVTTLIETKLGEIPEDWGVTTIGECCVILDSQRVPLSAEVRRDMKGDYPYYGANGQLDSIDKWIFDEPLILMAEDGGYFDDFRNRPIAYKVTSKCWVNNHAHVLRPKQAYWFDWVFYQLEHMNIIPYINGSTRTKLNQQELVQIRLPVAPLSEQHKIVEILSTVDEAIEKTDAIIRETQQLKKGLMQKLFVNKAFMVLRKAKEEETDLKPIAIHEIGEIVTGTTPSTTVREYYDNPEHMFIGPADIGQSKRIVKSANYISKEGFAVSRQLPCNTVMVVGIGATIGKVGITSEPCTTNQQINTIIPNTREFPADYVYYLLAGISDYVSAFAGQTATPIMNKGEFGKMLTFIHPTLEERQKIADILSEVDAKIETERAFKAELEQLKKGLMQVLLTGKIRVKV